MTRRYSFSLAFTGVLLTACLVWPASAREWTDAEGHRFEAVFLRFEDENAVLLRSGTVVTLPLADLSNPDLRHLRRELELAGLGHLVPPLGSSGPESRGSAAHPDHGQPLPHRLHIPGNRNRRTEPRPGYGAPPPPSGRVRHETCGPPWPVRYQRRDRCTPARPHHPRRVLLILDP